MQLYELRCLALYYTVNLNTDITHWDHIYDLPKTIYLFVDLSILPEFNIFLVSFSVLLRSFELLLPNLSHLINTTKFEYKICLRLVRARAEKGQLGNEGGRGLRVRA